MRQLLTSLLLFIMTGLSLCAQPPAPPPPPSFFTPGQPFPPFPSFPTDPRLSNSINNARARFSNEMNNVRARMSASQSRDPSFPPIPGFRGPPGTLSPSNRLATAIVEAYAKNDFTNAAALLKEFPGTIDDLRQYGQPLIFNSLNEILPGRSGQPGQTAKLDFLLEHKANPDTVTPFGEPVLIQAIQFRRWDAVAKLIEAGASVTRTNQMGRSAATMVFENFFPGNFGGTSINTISNIIPLMLEHGLDPFAPGQSSLDQPRFGLQSQTSILEECLSRENSYGNGWGWSSMISFGDLLLTNKPSPARRTPLGDTALHLAVYWQHTNAVDFLLNAGFNVDQTNDAGLTPLQSLAGNGGSSVGNGNFFGGFSTRGIRALRLSTGGPLVPYPSTSTMADYLLAKGATLDVFSAAGLGRTNELTALLATNAALANAQDGYGRTPLHYATPAAVSMGSQIRMITSGRMMVMNGAPSNPPPEVVLLLLKANANPSTATTKAIPPSRNFAGLPAGTTPLHLAARNGDTILIRTLLTARANAQLTDENGDSALHHAARTWATNALPLLITARAPLNATNLAGHTPLRAAVEARSSPSVDVLLKAGANLTNGLSGTTLLHLAAERGDVVTATLLLKRGLALDARDDKGRTPFQKAAAAKQWNSVVFIKKQGADINAIDNAGDSALHLLAAQTDDFVNHAPEEPELVEWERKQLATPGLTGRGLRFLINSKIINPPPAQSWTNTSLTTWLVEHGAKVNLTNRAGRTPLHVLCNAEWTRWYQNEQTSNRVMTLLNSGASLDLRDTNGLTPLHLAAASDSPQLFKFLLTKAGPRINVPDAQGRTLLHQAVENARENLERVVALLAAGANPNAADKQGLTPLHLAVRVRNDSYDYRRQDLVLTLLTNKANPNLADREGCTPLHLLFQAAGGNFSHYSAGIGPLLLTNGANPNAIDQAGRTALHALLGSSNPSVHQLLRDLLRDPRWDFTARDTNGQTPLHLWAAKKDPYGNDGEAFKQVVTNQYLANLTNYDGDTPLHLAIRANKDQVANAFMQAGADPLLKNLRGETALRLAVEKAPAYLDQVVHPPGTEFRFFDSLRQRDDKELNLWLKADSSLVSLTNQDGLTPLMAATDSGNTNIIARLLELGAPLDALSALRLGRMDDFRKLLPGVSRPVPGDWLFEAVRFGRLDALQALMTVGGDVQFADADGHSLLFRATEGARVAVVSGYAQDRRLPVGVANVLKDGQIAEWLSTQGCRETFFDAIINGDRESVESFIKADPACVNTANRNSRTPLYRATAAGKTELVALLLERGAKADAPVGSGWTPLHAAAATDAADIGQLLLKAGASPKAVVYGNVTPLHIAAALGCTNMAELLLKNGAEINLAPGEQTGYARATPLHWAAHLGKVDMFKLLLAHGADLNAVNQQNQTPLDFARATARGQHWNVNRPPETSSRYDQTMFQPQKRDAIIKQLEEAATIGAPPSPAALDVRKEGVNR